MWRNLLWEGLGKLLHSSSVITFHRNILYFVFNQYKHMKKIIIYANKQYSTDILCIPSTSLVKFFVVIDPKGAAEAFEDRDSFGCEDSAFEIIAKSSRSSHGSTITTVGKFFFQTNALCCQVMKILHHKVIPFFVCRQKVKKKKIFKLHSSTGCMLRAINLWPVWQDALMSFSYPVLKVWGRTIKMYVFDHNTIITGCSGIFSLLRKRRVCLDCAKTRATARGWDVLSFIHFTKENRRAGIKSHIIFRIIFYFLHKPAQSLFRLWESLKILTTVALMMIMKICILAFLP